MTETEADRLLRIERMLVFLIERQDQQEYWLSELHSAMRADDPRSKIHRPGMSAREREEAHDLYLRIRARNQHAKWTRDLYHAGLPLLGRKWRIGDEDERRGVDI
jgi:hypothetical protein